MECSPPLILFVLQHTHAFSTSNRGKQHHDPPDNSDSGADGFQLITVSVLNTGAFQRNSVTAHCYYKPEHGYSE